MQQPRPTLIQELLKPESYPHDARDIELIETHISWVILTGRFVYKIKKPVNFGFLDFSTLEKRHFYCEEEVRLNKRLAPAVYLDVVKITGDSRQVAINGHGPVLEYAVKMNQFPQSAQLDVMLSRDQLTMEHIVQIAEVAAQFHSNIQVAGPGSRYGSVEAIEYPVLENFQQIRKSILQSQDDAHDIELAELLQRWSVSFLCEKAQLFKSRKEQGYIRECHGDMHLRNIAFIDDRIVMFDCIEFNDEFRWVDVMSEIAFICMDLEDRNRPDFSQALLNRYLEITGEYAGLQLLRFYKVYRALVRAKVDALRLLQVGEMENTREDLAREFRSYLELARSYTLPVRPVLYITHGLSGSGKTTGTQSLLHEKDVVRIRSDIERKRLFGAGETDRSATTLKNNMNAGMYSARASEATYSHLYGLADMLLASQYSVVVDACFLRHADRKKFRLLAKRHNARFVILSFNAPVDTLKQRILKRQNENTDASDAGIAVLENQLACEHRLLQDEKSCSYEVEQGGKPDIGLLSKMASS